MMMKKFLMILMIPLLMMTINSESARAASLKDTPRLAILPYMDKSAKSNGLRLEDVTIVSEFVMEKLLDSGRFKIIEREKLKEIREEQKLSLQELSDPRFSIAIGKMASAQYLIAGSITGLSTKETGLTGSGTITNSSTGSKSGNSKGIGINAGVNKYTVIANITLRIIDLEDGTVVMAVSGTGESSIANVDFSLKQEVVNYFGEEEKLENPPTTGSTTPNNNQTNSDPATSGEDNQTNSDPATSGENNQTNSNPATSGEDNQTNSDPATSGENNQTNSGTGEEIYNEDGSVYDDKAVGTFENIEFIPLEFYLREGLGGRTVEGKIMEYKISIGGREISNVQVRNALYKAAYDAVFNKNYGLIAHLDGKAKVRKV